MKGVYYEEENLYGIGVPWGSTMIRDIIGGRKPFWAKPRPNLNLLHDTSMVPCLDGKIGKGCSFFGCLVGAGKDTAIWTKAPEVSFSEKDMTVTIDGKCHKLV